MTTGVAEEGYRTAVLEYCISVGGGAPLYELQVVDPRAVLGAPTFETTAAFRRGWMERGAQSALGLERVGHQSEEHA